MTEKEFINDWVLKLRNGSLKKFPDDFTDSINNEKLILPAKRLMLGSELFGTYEIVDTGGNQITQAGDLMKAKFIVYANHSLPEEIAIPQSNEEISLAVKSYERYLDDLLKEIIKEFRSAFPEKKNFFEAANTIFNSLDIHRY